MTTTIAEYSATDAALADLRSRYEAVVYDVTTGKGMDQAKKARAEIREHRVALEKERVRIKAPALERCRQIDSEAKRITAELESLEQPIDQQIKAEEERKAHEKAEKERIERERVAAIAARFDAIRAMPLRAVNASAAEIQAVIDEARAIDPATFPADMQDAAKYERQLAVNALLAALDRRQADDAEQERIKAERAELERLRAEQAAVQAERERLERERAEQERQAREAAERAEREAREAVERAEREAREAELARIAAERAEAQRLEDERLAAERERIAEERRRFSEEQRKAAEERAAQEKREREQAIAAATLTSAAEEALALLRSSGFADHLTTHKLAAALAREPQQRAA